MLIAVSACTTKTDPSLQRWSSALSGPQTVTFQDGTNGYSGTTDTYISQSATTTNFGSATTLSVDGDDPNGTGRDLSALLRWDLSSIPAGSTVQSASITLRVTNATANSYPILALSRTWSESTATWQRAATGTNWQVAGALGAADRETTSLGSISASATGTYAATLNASGIAKIKQWVDNPSQNFGFITASASNTDRLNFASSEASAITDRPRLTITFIPPEGPDASTDAPQGGAGAGGAAGGGAAGAGASGGSAGTAGSAPVVLYTVGDLGDCNYEEDSATGLLLDGSTDPIALAGDLAYPNGSAADFTNCFEPPWGRHKPRIRPAPGNHEYGTPGAAGYYAYFGAAAGDPGKGYYSYDLGAWHIVSLNSNCTEVSCAAGSAQEQWLRQDLAAHPTACTLAYWHHSRFSSGSHGNYAPVAPLWQALMDNGADVVVTAHNHGYERWVAMDANGAANSLGMVEWVVGTGGAAPQSQAAQKPANTVIRNASTRGVLKLTLRDTGYDWQYLPIPGNTFQDQGTASCHSNGGASGGGGGGGTTGSGGTTGAAGTGGGGTTGVAGTGSGGTTGVAGTGGGGAGGGGVDGGAGGGGGGTTDGGGFGGPGAPTGLTAAIVDRRKTSMGLTWTAPANASGGAVAGYQVRYAKVPINASNFDNATVTTAVMFTGTPAAPGSPDGITVSNLYIENGYYFGVIATDAAGNRGALAATPALGTGETCDCMNGRCCAAHFLSTVIASGSGSTDNFGYAINGEGDLNGDNLSDVLVATAASPSGRAYLYFGTSGTFSPSAASVAFSGSTATFGQSVSQIGDIDNDGRPDLAIGDPGATPRVYVFRGRATWPMTLTDAQADYVISGDATYMGSGLGNVLARLGDFTGDGIDDFAIGARLMNTQVGRVVIIPGRASGFASVTLPDTTNAIVIDGDAALGQPLFGTRIVGLGHFYTVSTGTTLIVGAPGTPASATASPGRVYAFHGQSGSGGSIAVSAADQSIVGPTTNTYVGSFLSNLGPVIGQYPNVGVGSPLNNVEYPTLRGCGYVLSGTPSTGPLTNKIVVSLSPGDVNDRTGPVILGGGLSGRDVALSLIGDATPDVLYTTQVGAMLMIADGTKVPSPPALMDMSSVADVKLGLSTGWAVGTNGGSLVPDVNGDAYVDFAVRNTVAPGSIAVYY